MSIVLSAKELPVTLEALARDARSRQRTYMVLAIAPYQSINGASIEQTLGALPVEITPYELGGGYRTHSPVFLAHEFGGRNWFAVAIPPGSGERHDFKTREEVVRACDYWLQQLEAAQQSQVEQSITEEQEPGERTTQLVRSAVALFKLPYDEQVSGGADWSIRAWDVGKLTEAIRNHLPQQHALAGPVRGRWRLFLVEEDSGEFAVVAREMTGEDEEIHELTGYHASPADALAEVFGRPRLGTTVAFPTDQLEVRYGGTKRGCEVPVTRLALTKTACANLDQTQASSPEAIVEFVKSRYDCSAQEVALLVGFDPRMNVLGVQEVSQGGLSMTAVDPRVVYAGALAMGASAIILIHNHPSGDPEPSSEDVRLTHQLGEGARNLGIRLVDHIVVGRGGAYASLQARGMMGRN